VCRLALGVFVNFHFVEVFQILARFVHVVEITC